MENILTKFYTKIGLHTGIECKEIYKVKEELSGCYWNYKIKIN